METREVIDIEPVKEENEIRRMSRSLFFRALVSVHGMKWLVCFSILLATGVVLSIFMDWEIIIFTLMLLFIVFPIAVMFLYFFHALKPLTLLNTTPHDFRLGKEGLEIIMTESDRKISVNYNELSLYSELGKGLIYTTSGSGWIWIGEVIFEDKDKFVEFIEQLNSRILKH